MRLPRIDGVLPNIQNRFEQSYPQALDMPLRAKLYIKVYSNLVTYCYYGLFLYFRLLMPRLV